MSKLRRETISFEEQLDAQIPHHENQRLVAMADPVSTPEISTQQSRTWPCNATSALLDAALVERITAGDEFALAALYDRYAGSLYLMLLRILKDAGTAEEVLQDLAGA
ncbi:MAG: RNA polymerase sigma factor [Acidobacteriota bacterium]